MNEALFLLHVVLIFAFSALALRLGKEALFTWIALQAVLANLFVLKQISFLGFHITCSDVFAIGGILGLNLLQEYYGKESAKQALWICLMAMVSFVILSQMHLFYRPSPYDISHAAYQAILSPAPRLLIASFSVFFIVQQIDLHFFAFLRKKFSSIPLSLRNGCSLVISQFLDTVLFSVFGLWGLVASLFDIIAISFLVKLMTIVLLSPLSSLSRKLYVKI